MKTRNADQVGAQTPPTPAWLRTCSWGQRLTTAPALPHPFLVLPTARRGETQPCERGSGSSSSMQPGSAGMLLQLPSELTVAQAETTHASPTGLLHQGSWSQGSAHPSALALVSPALLLSPRQGHPRGHAASSVIIGGRR